MTTTFTVDDIAELRRSVRLALGRGWPDARSSGTDDVDDRLRAAWAVAGELGLRSLGEYDAVGALLAVGDELGRLGCPLPLADAFVTGAAGSPPEFPDGCTAVHVGSLPAGGWLPAVEAGVLRTQVLVLDVVTGGATVHPIVDRESTPGLPEPAWSRLRAGPAAVDRSHAGEHAERADLVQRMFAVARAAGAAGRAVELAVEHARTRRQFGRLIGSFQAVSHRLVNATIVLGGLRALLADAARRLERGDAAGRLAGELALDYGCRRLADVQFAAHHTLAAIGYFDEHEAPWLFRRLHADLALARRPPADGLRAGDLLLQPGAALPDPDNTTSAAELGRAVRAALLDAAQRGLTGDHPQFVGELAQRGWLAPALPVTWGGLGADVDAQFAITEALAYHAAVPVARVAGAMLGPSIVAHAPPELQRETLPGIARGEFDFYLGYSESEAGSDLRHMRTTARRHGQDWVVSGVKMWGTRAYRADWCWLAARTEATPDAAAGVTVFLVPTRLPGWSCHDHVALSGERSCTTVFDDVVVSDRYRVGAVGAGWAIVSEALAHERVLIGAGSARLVRLFDDLLAQLRGRRDAQPPDARGIEADALAHLAATLQAARLLGLDALHDPTPVAAAVAKIAGSEFEELFGVRAVELLGPDALLEDPTRLTRWSFEGALRYSIMAVVSGGTNDIQRNIVAGSLDLPRR